MTHCPYCGATCGFLSGTDHALGCPRSLSWSEPGEARGGDGVRVLCSDGVERDEVVGVGERLRLGDPFTYHPDGWAVRVRAGLGRAGTVVGLYRGDGRVVRL